MLIRTYEDRDRERVEEICVITDNSHLERNLLFTLYCHYYIDYEKENCFVAEEDGKVVGYIISAKDNNTISKFFEWVTMSVSVRSISSNPNQAVIEDTYMFDKDEIEF